MTSPCRWMLRLMAKPLTCDLSLSLSRFSAHHQVNTEFPCQRCFTSLLPQETLGFLHRKSVFSNSVTRQQTVIWMERKTRKRESVCDIDEGLLEKTGTHRDSWTVTTYTLTLNWPLSAMRHCIWLPALQPVYTYHDTMGENSSYKLWSRMRVTWEFLVSWERFLEVWDTGVTGHISMDMTVSSLCGRRTNKTVLEVRILARLWWIST